MRLVLRFGIVVAAIAMGCSPQTASVAPELIETVPSGSLTVDWTIQGSADPAACDAAAVSAFEITILDRANQVIGRFQQSCNAFSTSVALDAGTYLADARLIDGAGVPRTTDVRIDSFTIYDNSQLTTVIDFAAIQGGE